MNVRETALPGVKIVEPRVFGDDRGYFFEAFKLNRYRDAGIDCEFIQDNVSFSSERVLRGLHLQSPNEQAKLVMVLQGAILDVAVDVRVGSPTLGKWVGEVLSSENHRQLFIPVGFAHGFTVLSPGALVSYKCAGLYDPSSELTVRWDDSDIGIEWNNPSPIISAKDEAGVRLSEIPKHRLPRYEPKERGL